mmetsp:Transcript_70921/g.114357  ORF Transcript_70921/g.114357 Transcript_70921/m.114357 type:complete len:323 (+) Transcript_70921:838-1806(+)
MDRLIVLQAGAMLSVGTTELLDGGQVWLQILDVGFKGQHASIDVGTHHLLQDLQLQVCGHGLPCKLLPLEALCLVFAAQLCQEIQGQLGVLLASLLQLVAPGRDATIELSESPCLHLHLIDQVHLLALQGTCLLDHLITLAAQSCKHFVLLSQSIFQLVVGIQDLLCFVIELGMLLSKSLQGFLAGLVLINCNLCTGLSLFGVLDHVVRIQEGLLDIAAHVLALLRGLLQLGFCLLELITADVHDLIVELSHLFLDGLVLLHDRVELVRAALDELLQLLELGLLVSAELGHLEHLEARVIGLHLLRQSTDFHGALLLPQLNI